MKKNNNRIICRGETSFAPGIFAEKIPRNRGVFKKTGAFTLVEVMVSIFILSIMSIAALSSFQHMIHAREVQKSHEAVLTSLSAAYTTIFNDFAQQTVSGDIVPGFHESEIFFTRLLIGEEGQLKTESIEYQWSEHNMTRMISKNDQNDQDAHQTLLANVKGIQWEWIMKDSWQNISVPLSSDGSIGTFPRAFKLTFTDPLVGEIEWVFICR